MDTYKTLIVMLSIIILFLVMLYFFYRTIMSQTYSINHQRAAIPIHQLIIITSGLVSFLCIGGGVVAVLYGAAAESELVMFGVTLKTGNVGVAFVGIGVIVGYFSLRAVLKNQKELAELPADDKSQ